MEEEIKVKDAMVNRVITIKPDNTVFEAALKMRDEGVGSLVVVKGDRPVGIVTRKDMTNKVVAENLKPEEVSVKDIMSNELVTCSVDDDILTAAKIMVKYGYKQLPVTSFDRLVGFISVREILAVAPAMIEIFKEKLTPPPVVEEPSQEGECELCGNYTEELKLVNGRWICETCSSE
ncbi:MAG: CBS domain-containing protein [Candidatus Micrarchaeota archaeon]|nr:CBS domain-containing protein [Candidatus Micrarchaeota archaeon]